MRIAGTDRAFSWAAPHYGLRYGCDSSTGDFQRLRGRPPLVSPLKLCMRRSFTAVTRGSNPVGDAKFSVGPPSDTDRIPIEGSALSFSQGRPIMSLRRHRGLLPRAEQPRRPVRAGHGASNCWGDCSVLSEFCDLTGSCSRSHELQSPHRRGIQGFAPKECPAFNYSLVAV